MKIALGNRRQLLLWGVLAVVLVLALVRMQKRPEASPTRTVARSGAATSLPGDSDPATSSRPPGGREGKKVSPDEVPIFTERDLDSAGSRPQPGGRNIFDFRVPTLPPPPTPTPAPPPAPVCGNPIFLGPCPPPPPTPTPLPPEISFKFSGTFGPKDAPIAVLTKAGEVINAHEGQVVFALFILRKINYESIDVGFVGRDPKDTRRVGLTP
jgi:hypothetical protein